jgi:hypothetical protein
MKRLVERKRVESYEGLIAIFNALLKEVKDLSKKNPEVTLNKTKVNQINRVLEDAKSVIESEPEAKYCDLLETEVLPQYSDAILVMAQFDGALTAFQSRHYGTVDETGINHDWYYDDVYAAEDVGDEDEDDEEGRRK